MAKQQKQRPMRMEQRGSLAAMQQLETRTDEQLEAETKFKAAALAILGARAAERYDARATRAYYSRAIAAARPQERLQLRRMADASIALAERRAGDLKDAVTKLGQRPPSNRQLLILRFMGLLAPPPGSGILLRLRGIAIVLGIVIVLLALGFGIAKLIALPFGGVGTIGGLLLGLIVIIAVFAVLALLGRRRQARARARAAAG
ncbi:hypothetical protein [Conexibacter woesei]|uniref:Uncharacterized protein n=1 Tax=Conexibacter woesei (strain DSM 14684 / CCUG 47730 / CIP 108061 / JCM 11494 / NBRC 100937 / ID131577) TaxID=469383 RepID=D3FEX5_CONWI|nr:hypothetical protein [Conexibacter woesei]ADB51692.1 hypothetical protein Cwoe_3274 [Conexibacter woesei DSM 14684]